MKQKKHYKPLFIAVIAFCISFLLLLELLNQRQLIIKEQETSELNNAANLVKEKVLKSLQDALSSTTALSVIYKNYGLNNNFDSVAKKILEVSKTVSVLSLVEGEVITKVYPITGYEKIINHNVFKDSTRNKEILKAIASKKIYYTGPFTFKKGGFGMIARLPIFDGEKYKGIAMASIDFSTFLERSQLNQDYHSRYIFQFSKINPNTQKEEFFLTDSIHVFKKHYIKITVPEGDWMIYAAFTKKNFATSFWIAASVVFMLSCLIGYFAWYFVRQPERLKDLVEEKTKLLQSSENNYASLFNQAMEPMLVTNNKGIIYDVNESFCNLIEYSKEELLNTLIESYIDPEDLAENPVDYNTKLIGYTLFRERKLKKKSGETAEVEVSRKQIANDRIMLIGRDVTHLRKIQKQIALSEATLSAAFAKSSIGMSLVTMDGILIRVNQQMCKMLGYSEAELMKLNIRDITYSDTSEEETFELYSKIKKGEIDSYKLERRYITKSGTLIWVDLNVSIVRDDNNKPLFIISQSQDISEAKKTAAALDERNEQLRLFIEHSPAALAMFDTNMCYIVTSRRWMKDYNLVGIDIIGKNHYEVFPEIGQEWKDIHQRCLTGITEKKEDDFFLRADGSVDWVKWEIHPWKKGTGEIGGIIMLTEVTTKTKQAELKFRSLAEQSAVGVHIIQNGKYAYVNPLYAEMFGLTSDEIINKLSPQDLILEDDLPVFQKNYDDRLSGKVEFVHYEVRGKRKNGEIIWIDAYGSMIKASDTTLLIGSFVDITQRKSTEQEIINRITQLENISNNLPDVMLYQLVIDPVNGKRKFIYISKEVTKLTGYTPAEVMENSQLLYNCLHLDDMPILEAAEFESVTNLSLFNVEMRFHVPGGEVRLMSIRSVPRKQPNGTVLWDGIQTDITEQKKVEQEIKKLNRLYLFISKANELLLRSENKEELFAEACRIAVEYGKVRMAWIGVINEEQIVEPFVWYGHEEGYLKKISIIVDEKHASGKGPTATAIRNLTYAFCNDFANDTMMLPWREEALQRGYRSSISYPIVVNNKVEAVFTLYVSVTNFFNETEVKLLKEVVDNIASALEKIRIRQLHHKVEVELKKSEEINRAIINAFPDKIFRIKKDGTILDFHAYNELSLYVTPKKIKGNKLSEILPANAAQSIMHAMQKAFTTKELVTLEYVLPYDSGERFHEGRIIAMANGEVLLVARDITERKNAEAELLKRNAEIKERVKELNCLYRLSELSNSRRLSMQDLLNKVVELIPPAYQYPEITCTRISYQNQIFQSNNFIESSWKQEAPITVNDIIVGKIEVFYIEEKPSDFEGPFLKEERFLINTMADIIKNSANRKKVEIELTESEAKFRSIVDAAPSAILVLDYEMNVIEANPYSKNIFEYEVEEIKNQNIAFLVEENIAEIFEEYVDAFKLNPKQFLMRSGNIIKGRTKSGNNIIVDVSLNTYQLDNQNYILAIINDITQRVKHEKQIAEQLERLKRIAWQQSHEVRRPLANILGLIDLLQLNESSNENERKELLGMLYESTDQLDAIVKTITKYANSNDV